MAGALQMETLYQKLKKFNNLDYGRYAAMKY